MAHIIKDRVLEQSTTAGLGAFTLAGAALGFRAFASVCSVSDTVWYYIEAIDSLGKPSGAYEYGIGTYSGANTLTRTTVLGSSNSGSLVDFAAGTKLVGLGIVAPGTNTVNRHWRDALGLPLSVENFGAVGNGSTDDTTALQDAIDSAKPVYLTEGKTYLFTADLEISTNFQRFGGPGVLKPDGNCGVVVNGGAVGVEVDVIVNSSTHSDVTVKIDDAHRTTIRLNAVDCFDAIYVTEANVCTIE